jgi:hypothetical protein
MVKQLPAPAAERRPTLDAAGSGDRTFPLVALLQLATFWAALAACVDGAQLRSLAGQFPDRWWLGLSMIAAAVAAGAGIGLVLGLGQLRPVRNAIAGMAVGSACGAALLAAYAAPAPPDRGMAAAAMLLATTIALRVRAA